jgi:hypothetical protein
MDAGGSAAASGDIKLAPAAHFFGIEQATARSTSNQEFAGAHHWFSVEPHVEVATDAVNVRF